MQEIGGGKLRVRGRAPVSGQWSKKKPKYICTGKDRGL